MNWLIVLCVVVYLTGAFFAYHSLGFKAIKVDDQTGAELETIEFPQWAVAVCWPLCFVLGAWRGRG